MVQQFVLGNFLAPRNYYRPPPMLRIVKTGLEGNWRRMAVVDGRVLDYDIFLKDEGLMLDCFELLLWLPRGTSV